MIERDIQIRNYVKKIKCMRQLLLILKDWISLPVHNIEIQGEFVPYFHCNLCFIIMDFKHEQLAELEGLKELTSTCTI